MTRELKYLISLLAVFLTLHLPASLFASLRPASTNYRGMTNQNIDVFANVMAQYFGMHHLLSGGGGMIDVQKVIWCLAFTSSQNLTLEEARSLALQMVDALWCFAIKDPVFIQYIESTNQERATFQKLQLEPLNLSYFGFKLGLWDAEVNRPLSPYLAQVTFTGKELLYFYADPTTQALLPPIKESLNEAPESCNCTL